MKGLIQTSIIIALIIMVGIGVSIIITNGLNGSIAVAHESGYDKGHAQGYLDGFQEGSEAGYQDGSKIGYVQGTGGGPDGSYGTGFYFVYNPTYDEVREILAETGKSSVREIHDYAEVNGIRAVYVRVQIARQATEGMVYLYELVAFETVDSGFIIIEPWSHREVKVELGKHYRELNGYSPSPHDDTITKITIVW